MQSPLSSSFPCILHSEDWALLFMHTSMGLWRDRPTHNGKSHSSTSIHTFLQSKIQSWFDYVWVPILFLYPCRCISIYDTGNGGSFICRFCSATSNIYTFYRHILLFSNCVSNSIFFQVIYSPLTYQQTGLVRNRDQCGMHFKNRGLCICREFWVDKDH